MHDHLTYEEDKMRLALTVAIVLLSALPAFAQAGPTCEEQVALLQSYVTELANQRSALESRLIMTQAELKRSQTAPNAAGAVEKVEAEKARVRRQALKGTASSTPPGLE